MAPEMCSHDEKGMALVTTLMLSLLLSILVGGMLLASTSDTLIGSNDIRNNQAFYVAEAGINRAAGWFTAKFGTAPDTGLYVLPEKYLGANYQGSNTSGAVGKLSYTTGEKNYQGNVEAAPYYKPGAYPTTNKPAEQAVPTSVKTLADGYLQNVVLAGDSTNTYPTSYAVASVNSSGVATTYTYNNVVADFTNHLFKQQVGDGSFTVKAILISILVPDGQVNGTITWLIRSEGTLSGGIASATVWAYMSAQVSRVEGNRTVTSTAQVVNADPGVVSRGMIAFNSNSVRIDSYRSSRGGYGAALAANSYEGQIGAYNVGSRGDVRTNNELVDGIYGYINISNGVVTGRAYSTDPPPATEEDPDPINIDPNKVLHSDKPSAPFDIANKYYSQPLLMFPDIPDIPKPTGGNYTHSKNTVATLPAGNYRDISISKGRLTVPAGTYGVLDLSSQGTVVLGTPGQTTTYNFQGFISGAQTQIIYRGPVVINVQSSLDLGGQGSISDIATPASAIHWNFKGGQGEVVSLGGGSDTLGVFYAPNNVLRIRGNGDFYGGIAAKSVDINGNGAIHIDEDALLPLTTTKEVIVTATIVVGYTASNYSLWRITQQLD